MPKISDAIMRFNEQNRTGFEDIDYDGVKSVIVYIQSDPRTLISEGGISLPSDLDRLLLRFTGLLSGFDDRIARGAVGQPRYISSGDGSAGGDEAEKPNDAILTTLMRPLPALLGAVSFLLGVLLIFGWDHILIGGPLVAIGTALSLPYIFLCISQN